MAYDTLLADLVREHLEEIGGLQIEEKKMFSGLAFLVNGKMCINISGDNLMCRFDPAMQAEVAERNGFRSMIMKGKEMNGFCYVEPAGFANEKDFQYWLNLCLVFNDKAKKSGKKKK